MLENLQEATEVKSHGLEEALSLMQFKRKVDAVLVLVGESVSAHWCQVYTGRGKYGKLWAIATLAHWTPKRLLYCDALEGGTIKSY